MNDYFSGSLLEVNKTALEHGQKLSNWTDVVRQFQTDEKELQEVAIVSNTARPIRPAWYCPLLERMGAAMISLGTHLKANYSTDHALRPR
jgi:hypothetical protein